MIGKSNLEEIQDFRTQILWTGVDRLDRWRGEGTKPDAQGRKRIAMVLDVSVDYLLFDDLPRTEKGHIYDPELLKKLMETTELDDSERDVIKKVIDAMLAKKKLKNLAKEVS